MAGEIERAQCLDEYEKLVTRMNNPRVVIDNDVCTSATLIKVDSARKSGVLLEAVQALTDLNLSIKKAYISSDGRWFMDVFHVTDQFGAKLIDESIRTYLEQSLVAGSDNRKLEGFSNHLTALELTGSDRPGILSEVFAVLADLQCNVVDAKVWTHNGRVASLMHVKDEDSGSIIEDTQKIQRIERRLHNVLRGTATTFPPSPGLHQMMSADRESGQAAEATASSLSPSPPLVSVQNWIDRGYSIVNVQCRDRPKLLFDILCTLTDMEYVVFHGTIDTVGDRAYQEFYIRHADGSAISSETSRQRVIQRLQSGVERRSHRLCTVEQRGLLSEVTRVIRENGLSITGAEVSTKGAMSCNVFYVTDVTGNPAEARAIEAVRQRIGLGRLVIKEPPTRLPAYGSSNCPDPGEETAAAPDSSTLGPW
ncbi:unnamed protein product [Spirodela intermedia]|uniref:ACT domain-containing protein ACR n=1 Tax=Spirodela intermedia TaxID=51605 RepID=A0A7I8JTV9_SPIIN|nr:unnamed protein product [Spirodela intermedia]CAA6673616.1 unnamed protein product [Spirodela intermedia]